jgi:hypothetical protein
MFILLTLLLVVTPYASWYYLTKGLDYRKAQLALLEDFGTIPPGNWSALNGDPVDTKLWSDQLSLISIATNVEQGKQELEEIQRLHTQFQDRTDVRFYCFIPEEMQTNLSLSDVDSSLVIIGLPSVNLIRLSDQWSGIIKKETDHQVILVDRLLQVRQAFSTQSEKSLKDLVQVIAVLLPPKKVERPNLVREAEK